MLIAGVGIIFSIIGTLFVRISDNAGISTAAVQKALNMGNWGSIVLTAIASYFLVNYILPDGHMYSAWILNLPKWVCLGAIIVGLGSRYFNEYHY